MKFHAVAEVFHRIEQESSRTAITSLLGSLLEQTSVENITPLIYLSLGMLEPSYKNLQSQLGQKNIIAALTIAANIDEKTIAETMKTYGDLGSVYEHHYKGKSNNLSLQEVYDALYAIASMGGTGSQEKKINAFADLLKQLNAQEGKYAIRTILGTLRLGFSDMTVIDALSWMICKDKSLHDTIEEAYNKHADIGHIAHTLKKDGVKGLEKISITLGIPIRLAGAERASSVEEVMKRMGTCVAQPKIDGFRLQIHVDHKKNMVSFFSRHLVNMSASFPDIVAALTHINANSYIIEGEAIGYDPNLHTFLPFQETVKRKRKHDVEESTEKIPLHLYVFDVLYVDGISYIDTVYTERRKILNKLLPKAITGKISIIDEKEITNTQELESYFNRAIDQGLEGLIVKNMHATYQAGKRNFNWIKLKGARGAFLHDSIDCVILGYYNGEGKRAILGIGALLVGVYNKHHDGYETIARVGTGFSDQDFITAKHYCDEQAVKQKPEDVICAKELEPDVWVKPTIVCTIEAEAITISPTHTAGKTEKTLGYALRFPRFIGYRFDKDATQSTSVEEVKALYEQLKNK